MLVEMRTYTFHPGMIPPFLALYQGAPLSLQKKVLGNLLGYFTVETGELNQTVHLWGYESLDDRLRRRSDLAAHHEWLKFLDDIFPLLVRQESKLLVPTGFSPAIVAQLEQ